MKTYSLKAKDITEKWHVVDAADQPLGRLATRIASLLRGKHRPEFTPHLDMRDFVVVVNAERVRVTGNNKMRDKIYYRHTRYPGGLKEVTLERMMATHPTRVIEHAVRGMLPHNRLGAKLRRHLHVYVGPEHPHYAQTGDVANKPKKPVEKPVAKAKAEPEPVAEVPAEAVAEETAEEPEAVAEEPVKAEAATVEEEPVGEAPEAAVEETSEEAAAAEPDEAPDEPKPEGAAGGEAP
jgi:large subunit ribosomal protein L13